MSERVVWNEEKRCHERFADLDRAGVFEIWECVSADEERRHLAKRRKRDLHVAAGGTGGVMKLRHMEDLGYEHVPFPPASPEERERVAWRMGYQAGRTDERTRQWRAQTNSPASEDAELSDGDGVIRSREDTGRG